MEYSETVEVEEGDNAGLYALGGILAYNLSLYDSTLNNMMSIYNPMMNDYQKEISSIFGLYKSGQISLSRLTTTSQAALTKLSKKWQKIFNIKGKPIAAEYVVNQLAYSKAMVRNAITPINPSPDTVFKDTPEELKANQKAAYFAIIAMMLSGQRFYAEKLGFMVSTAVKSGVSSGIDDYMDKQRGITDRWVKGKLGDNFRQDYNAFNRQLMEANGYNDFLWHHTDRSKEPRPLHKQVLNGQVYSISNPPVIDLKSGQVGFPGDLWECKCMMRMVKKI